MKTLSKLDGLSLTQLRKAKEEFINAGSKQTVTFANVEPGLLEGKPEVITNGEIKTVNFFIIPYERDGEKRHFTGAYFSGKHQSTGKQYDKLAVGLTEEEEDKVNEPENRGKSYDLRAVPYKTTDGQDRVIVKMI